MPYPRQTSLRSRLILGMGAMLLPLVALGAGAFISLESAVGAFERTEEETLEELFPLTHLESLVVKASVPAEDYLLTGDLAQHDRFVRLSREVDNNFAAVLAAPSELTEKQILVRASQKEWQQTRRIGAAIFAPPDPLENLSATQKLKHLEEQIGQTVDSLKQLSSLLIHLQIAENLTQAKNVKSRVKVTITAVFGLGLGVAVAAGLVLARSILVPLRVLEEGVDRLGEGNLSHRINLATHDELGRLALAFNLMASKLEQSQTGLKNLATVDGLTGVYNRREFNQRLTQEIERSRRYGHPCSLLMVDLDFFKKLNDTYGHLGGDEALRATAALIKQEVRPGDQVARYGGEEFAVILPETAGPSAVALAERLREAIANQAIALTPEQTISLTASMGLATFPQDAGSEEELIAAADQGLYAAKRTGRNRVYPFQQVIVQELASSQALLPSHEIARLKSLYRYNILDSPAETAFDDLTHLAAAICGTPIALISLVDSTRQWFKAKVGTAASETSRDVSFCAHAILQPDPLIIQDARQDSRFANNSLVTGEPKIRFYAGAPLVTPEGYAIGTLCVIDYTPRELSLKQTQALQALAHQVVAQLESRNLADPKRSQESLSKTCDKPEVIQYKA